VKGRPADALDRQAAQQRAAEAAEAAELERKARQAEATADAIDPEEK
jgi:hypothetical protein